MEAAMAKHEAKGAFRQLAGDVKRTLGKATGDRRTQADGAVQSAAGRAQTGFGRARSKVRRLIKG
jgi:uncharacterized protein YjbJ (UPF0337 family)